MQQGTKYAYFVLIEEESISSRNLVTTVNLMESHKNLPKL